MKEPKIASSARVMQGAVLMGDVQLGEECGVWPNAVLRADLGTIRVGNGTNIQDGCVFHIDEAGTGYDVLELGEDITVGHMCILHGCKVGDNSLIGMGSIVMDGSHIGKNCLIGAGSLVTSNTKIPDGHLAFGRPAKVQRALTEKEIDDNRRHAQMYKDLLKQQDET